VRYIGIILPTLKIVYLTYDGLNTPLGSSQILPYLRGLRGCSFSPTVISLEQGSTAVPQDAEQGIARVELRYRTGGMSAHIANFRAMLHELRKTIEATHPEVVVARSYLPAAIALRAKRSHRIPYIFDMRGCWVDERAMGNGRFRNPLMYRAGKRWERSLLRNADGVITLTKLHAQDLVQQRLLASDIPVRTIPTCADFDRFRIAERKHDRLVIGWIGSVNASYHVRPSLELFEKVRRRRPDAFLRCLTGQPEMMRKELLAMQIPQENYSVTSAEHREMPDRLAQMDWGLLLNENGPGKRGSMPTKLAEFFASGVRPIQYGCNPEVAELVRASGVGVILKGLSEQHLEQAATEIVEQPLDRATAEEARRHMRPYFGLESGIAAYSEILRSVVSRQERAK